MQAVLAKIASGRLGLIYEKMIVLAEQRMPIDPVTLQSALARAGALRHTARLLRNRIIMREGRHGDVPAAPLGKAF